MKTETIIRYSNRKLYSKTTSKYVDLPSLLTRVRNGVTIQVVDYVTSKDLTEITLTKAEFQEKLKAMGK